MLAMTKTKKSLKRLPTRKSPNTFSLTFEWIFHLNVTSGEGASHVDGGLWSYSALAGE